jgi:hypothetical protein
MSDVLEQIDCRIGSPYALISANDRRLLSDCKQEIERLREERDECRRLLRGLVLASECFLSSEIVYETSGTIPLMDRLEKAIAAARAAGGGDHESQ